MLSGSPGYMAAVSLSPTPTPIAAMSARRAPLASNPNVANSPLRGLSTLAGYAKQKRSHVEVQREEPHGQLPPVKKQMLDNNGGQRAIRSPPPRATAAPRTHVVIQRAATAGAAGVAGATVARPTATRERVSRAAAAPSAGRAGQGLDIEKEAWRKHYRTKFPKMVFYFESIPDDIRAKLTKRVTYFGARQEPFFSIEVTHVITTRAIPPERPSGTTAEGAAQAPGTAPEQRQRSTEEQPQTINPSLLDRKLDRNTAARRKLLFDFRQAPMPAQQLDDAAKRPPKPRNSDVLHKSRDMGKKIWSLDKFQTMLSVLLESESHNVGSYNSRALGMRSQYGGTLKGLHEPNLLQLLRNERIHGPSDRDPTATNRDLSFFKGPHIYVWDMDDRVKPIVVREYPKVPNKVDGEWPQFRSVCNGRCPFVEETEDPDKDHRKGREREKAKAAANAKRDNPVPMLKPPAIPPAARTVNGKRTLTEMADGHNRATHPVTPTDVFNPAKAVMSQHAGMRMQNAFTSRAEGGRLFAGEPAASGMQPSTITSAIRSQMISSTSGIHGIKAGTSKEMYGLQRKVLQKARPACLDAGSRRPAEVSLDVESSRSTTLGRRTSKTVQAQDDDAQHAAQSREKRSRSQPPPETKKDLKPGYCENCLEKFEDFDEHIVSRKHRKFAEDKENWAELDLLLVELKRMPKHSGDKSEDEAMR